MKSYSLRDARRLAIGTSDWRQAMWNKWLVGYLTPRADEQKSATSSGARAAPDEFSTPSTSQFNVETETPLRTSETLRPPVPSPEFEHPTSTQLRENEPIPDQRGSRKRSDWTDEQDDLNRHAQRARTAYTLQTRLQYISDQLDALELTLDRHSERENLARVQQRVQERALSDILDRLVEAQERQTQGIVSCTRALERLERRLVANEREVRTHGSGQFGATEQEEGAFSAGMGESIVPPSMTQRVQGPTGSSSAREVVAPLSGQLSEISLPTLLSMAELECWTGRLMMEAAQRTLLLDLQGGLLVGVFEDDSPTDAVEALYDLVEVRTGRFSFSPSLQVAKTELAPMTVGTLLLRASHRRDEVSRSDAAANA